MPELPKDTIRILELMSKLDPEAVELDLLIQSDPAVPDNLKEYASVQASTGRLNTFIRDTCIYREYLDVKMNGGLPLKKGSGGWYAKVGERYIISDSAIDSAVTRMKKFFKE